MREWGELTKPFFLLFCVSEIFVLRFVFYSQQGEKSSDYEGSTYTTSLSLLVICDGFRVISAGSQCPLNKASPLTAALCLVSGSSGLYLTLSLDWNFPSLVPSVDLHCLHWFLLWNVFLSLSFVMGNFARYSCLGWHWGFSKLVEHLCRRLQSLH